MFRSILGLLFILCVSIAFHPSSPISRYSNALSSKSSSSIFSVFIHRNHDLSHLESPSSSHSRQRQRFTVLYAQVAKKESEVEQQQTQEEERVEIPLDGIIGGERGQKLFDSPLDIYDPMKNTDDLPGEDGSDEKVNAIMQRIEERVAMMKARGEWDDGDNFSKDPLANQPIYKTMLMQLKACRPFESVDELVLTYGLVLFTTFFLSAYLLILKEYLNDFMLWFTGTDFDSDFMNEVMRNISA